MDVGSELAQARERLGLSVADLSRRTKIGISTLHAIERNEMSALPGGIYNRGFLRTVAREVGCDPKEIVARYREQFPELDREVDVALGELAVSGTVYKQTGPLHSADIDAMDRKKAHVQTFFGVALALCGALYIYYSVAHRPPVSQQKTARAVTSASRPAPAPVTPTEPAPRTEVGTTGQQAPPARPADAEAAGLRLVIQPRGPSWLAGTADGEQVVYRMLNPGERTQINARDDVVLRIGDAAAFAFTINGLDARPLGAPGQPVTIHLTRQNYREFLSQ